MAAPAQIGAVPSPHRPRASSSFSLTKAAGPERALGPLFGLFLTYSVARVQEVFPQIEVPSLPKVIGFICLLVLATTINRTGWKTIWRSSIIFRAMVGLLGLALVTMFIGIWSVGSWDFFQKKYMVQWGTFLIGTVLFRDRRILRQSLQYYCLAVAAAAYMAVSGNTEIVGKEGRVYIAGDRGSIDPNDFGAILIGTIPLTLWLASSSGKLGKLLWYSAALVMTAAVAPTASRGALLGIAAVALSLILIGTSGFKRLIMGGGVALGMFLFQVVATDEQLARFGAFGGEQDYNMSDKSEGRLAIWKRGIVWTIKRPTGYGLGNFPVYFGWLNGREKAAHSALIQTGVELGVAGLALFLLIYGTGVRDGRRYLAELKRLPKRDPRRTAESSLTGFSIAALLGIFTTGLFLSAAYASITMLVFAVTAGVHLGRASPVFPDGQTPTNGSNRRVGRIATVGARIAGRRTFRPTQR